MLELNIIQYQKPKSRGRLTLTINVIILTQPLQVFIKPTMDTQALDTLDFTLA